MPVDSRWPMISIFCLLFGSVRTANCVLNSKYFPGLRMELGIEAKEIFFDPIIFYLLFKGER
ncbi:hypothetical protein ASZ90_007848 [hydrocarbon metagenome]|uniref:Uncharacterized protein n=1 Tax=hydrocarbon metagenome TaxID=938273 RepID=A0A0W8FNP6_9ZZZZ